MFPGGNSENSWWGWPPGSPNPDPISDQKMSFIIPGLGKLCHHYLD